MSASDLYRIRKGRIKLTHPNKIQIVTIVHGEETIDFFTFDEIESFIRGCRAKKYRNSPMKAGY